MTKLVVVYFKVYLLSRYCHGDRRRNTKSVPWRVVSASIL